MKLLYCTHSTCNPGGMERVLLNKVAWLVKHKGWEVVIVTTDQHGKPAFYPVPEGVRQIDLGINYSEDNEKNPILKIAGYLVRRRRHRKALSDLLMRERPNVTVSLFPSESSFIPSIKDGSKKVLELHFCKFFRVQYGRSGIMGFLDKVRTKQDEKLVRKFDRFVVLTNEDRQYWGNWDGIVTIPNAALAVTDPVSPVNARRVIAVGRLDYQKGFDRLIKAWDIVQKTGRYNDWQLDIFGQGEWQQMLQEMIESRGLERTLHLRGVRSDIWKEYKESSFHVMTSNYEGLPMVMIEAMSSGLPVVTFDFLCGPRDIIRDGRNGLLVRNGDIPALAQAMMKMMDNPEMRQSMGREARKVVETYSEEAVMAKWVKLFEELIAN